VSRFWPLCVALTVLCGCSGAAAPANLDAALEDAWRSYSTGDFEYAIVRFDLVRQTPAADEEQRFSALLGLAFSYQLRPNPDLDRAREYYELLEKMGTDRARRAALLGLGQIDLAEGASGDGETKLVALMHEYPDSIEADEAAIHLADSLFRPQPVGNGPGRYVLASGAVVERGLRLLEERLRERPHNPLAAAMHMMLAGKYIELEDFEKAVPHLIAAEKEGIAGVKLRGTVLWRIARIADKRLKDYALAERYYQRYVDEFQRSALYYLASQSLERVRQLQEAKERDES